MKILGYEKFISKKSNKDFVRLYCSVPPTNGGGVAVETLIVSPADISGILAVDKNCEVFYRNGYVSKIVIS